MSPCGRCCDDRDERDALCADVAEAYSPEPPEVLAEVLAELLADPVLAPLADYDGSHARAGGRSSGSPAC